MTTSIDIDAQGGHQYVVRLRDDDEVTDSWFTITPSLLERLRGDGEDEEHFVRRTAEFLVGHQGVADFPDIVDLEDVMATYDDNFVEFLGRTTDAYRSGHVRIAPRPTTHDPRERA